MGVFLEHCKLLPAFFSLVFVALVRPQVSHGFVSSGVLSSAYALRCPPESRLLLVAPNNSAGGEGRAARGSHNGGRSENSTNDRFLLPIFPLRKSVKIPTETLTLNLYEDRYLALAEYVLSNRQCTSVGSSKERTGCTTRREKMLFGALYCSDKPQIVKGGTGPITPLIDEGDVGVVCDVLHSEEGMVPSRSDEYPLRRRIKLIGFAVGRFRVERIIQNGFDGGEPAVEGGNSPLPFILVEASRVDDKPPKDAQEEGRIIDLERTLYKEMIQLGDLDDERASSRVGDRNDDEETCYVSAYNFATIVPPELAHLEKNMTRKDISSIIEQALLDWGNGLSGVDTEELGTHHQRQLFSFSVSSTLIPDRPPDELLNALRTRSTYDRLNYVHQTLKRRKGWFAGLFDT